MPGESFNQCKAAAITVASVRVLASSHVHLRYIKTAHDFRLTQIPKTIFTMPNETQRYRKHFIPLESNPEVFTELVHRLGVSGQLCFQDVYSLTDTELLASLPRPAYALVLVFPAAEAYWEKVELEEEELAAYAGSGPDEETIFFKQTINNACGLYALLHAVCNGEARSKIGERAARLYYDYLY